MDNKREHPDNSLPKRDRDRETAGQLPAPVEPEPFPRMVFKSPEVEVLAPLEPLQRTVATQEELDAATADGWHEDPAQAQKAAAKKK